MAGGLYPVAGSKLYIGDRVTAKGTVTSADFTSANWTEVGGWANAGSVGDTQEVGEQALINERRIRKFKTTLNGGTMENQFVPMALDPGQIKFKQAIDDCQPYQFRIQWGADCIPESAVTFAIGTPGVVTWTNHGFVAGQPVIFETDDALPAELTAGTVYYIVASGLTTDDFSVSATSGGAAIDFTDAGTGNHTATAPPAGFEDMFYGLALPGARSGGAAADVHLRTWSISVDSNLIEV